ncbi:MAG: arsenate reductase family protein [Oscillospiraceae bacterium]|nr:arsenate reductase family protein [Oscillospiraceae bacterium]
MPVLFLWYPKCSTCQKAKKWLDTNGIEYIARNIAEEEPTREELTAWIANSGLEIKRFYNTSGQLYRLLELKEKLPYFTDEEKIGLLATDGMLVKRPLLISGETVLVGFKEEQWESIKEKSME